MKPLIDISIWQDPSLIDYDRLAAQIDGAILRVGYGTHKDTAFERHYAELHKRGVPLGVYYFPLDGNVGLQVDKFAQLVEGKYFALGAWVDVEHPLWPATLSKPTVDTFMRGVRARMNYQLGIYTSMYKWREIMADSAEYAHYPLWVANYGAGVPALPRPWKKWCIWQYSDRGRLPGYSGNLDMNRYDETCLASIKPLGEVGATPEPTQFPFKARVTARNCLAVRKAPSTSGEFVRWNYYGATVTVYAIEGDWWRISPVQSLWSAAQHGGEQLMERVDGHQVYLPIVAGPAPTPEPEPVKPATILGVPQYSQRDPRWAGIRLGSGMATIGQQGCLITAVAAVCRYYGKDTDPAQLNRDLLRVGGYANGNLYKWWSLGAIYPDIRVREYIDCQTVPAPLDKIDAELAAGRPPIVWVDFNPHTPANDMHWVVIVGHTEGRADYLIMDPWTGQIVPFRSLYADPARYIFRIVSYARG